MGALFLLPTFWAARYDPRPSASHFLRRSENTRSRVRNRAITNRRLFRLMGLGLERTDAGSFKECGSAFWPSRSLLTGDAVLAMECGVKSGIGGNFNVHDTCHCLD